MSLELTTPTTALSDEQAAWLADTMARNRARFGGWSMEADVGDGGDSGSDGSDAGDSGADDTDAPEDGDDQSDDARVERANRQAQRYRTELRETQATVRTLQEQVEQSGAVLTALRAAFGDKADEVEPAEQVTALTGQVESLTNDNAALSAALVVHDLASDLNARASALLDSKAFTTALAGLDPADKDYRTQVADAIKDAVSKNPAYRSGAGKGGSELNPDDREQNKRTRAKGLSAALSGHYKS